MPRPPRPAARRSDRIAAFFSWYAAFASLKMFTRCFPCAAAGPCQPAPSASCDRAVVRELCDRGRKGGRRLTVLMILPELLMMVIVCSKGILEASASEIGSCRGAKRRSNFACVRKRPPAVAAQAMRRTFLLLGCVQDYLLQDNGVGRAQRSVAKRRPYTPYIRQHPRKRQEIAPRIKEPKLLRTPYI